MDRRLGMSCSWLLHSALDRCRRPDYASAIPSCRHLYAAHAFLSGAMGTLRPWAKASPFCRGYRTKACRYWSQNLILNAPCGCTEDIRRWHKTSPNFLAIKSLLIIMSSQINSTQAALTVAQPAASSPFQEPSCMLPFPAMAFLLVAEENLHILALPVQGLYAVFDV